MEKRVIGPLAVWLSPEPIRAKLDAQYRRTDINLSRYPKIVRSYKVMATAILALTCIGFSTNVQSGENFYISLDTGPTHFRNQVVARFVDELHKAVGKQLNIKVFHSGQLFKGRDELKGLAWGNIQMAVPGALSLSRFEPNLNIFTLPAFYGLPYCAMRHLIDGPTVELLNDRLERRLPVAVIGEYLELGYLHTFSTNAPITSISGYRGLTIRVPGGGADIERYKLLGANPIAIPYSDLHLALNQGAVDGVSSSYESVRSGMLWDTGLLYAFEDRSAYYLYLPLVSEVFWERSGPDIQKAIINSWSIAVTNSQALSKKQQQEAKIEFESHGGIVTVPLDNALHSKRQNLRRSTPAIVRHLRMNVGLVEQALHEIDVFLSEPRSCAAAEAQIN